MTTEQLYGESDQVVQVENVHCRNGNRVRRVPAVPVANNTITLRWQTTMTGLLRCRACWISNSSPIIGRLDEIAATVEIHAEHLTSLADRMAQIENDIVYGGGYADGGGSKTYYDVNQLRRELKYAATADFSCQKDAMTTSPAKNAGERPTIWRGTLEWNDKSVPCAFTSNAKVGEPEVSFDNWPPKLVMQVLPKALICNIGENYMKNSSSVTFHPAPCPASVAITKKLNSNFAGCITLNRRNSSSADSSLLKVLILLYAPDKKVHLGFMPNDQSGFVQRLRYLIQQRKNDQKMRKLASDPRNLGTTESQTPVWCNNLVAEMQLLRQDNSNVIHQLRQSLAATQQQELPYQPTHTSATPR